MKIGLMCRDGDYFDVVHDGVVISAQWKTVALVEIDILQVYTFVERTIPPIGEMARHGNHRGRMQLREAIEVRVKIFDFLGAFTHGPQ